ncbi:protein EARLY-RESPONSIVE TO DEHYDRATION 7, chloroplastic-like [Curcuma longa]|uniref:protein EARLY-RESPONSIVE TO DEHYDRATION 7, chloroplastic-like n=1 Tax=Curcuma longa TaxID=136217 RepID=UPI003D9EF87F
MGGCISRPTTSLLRLPGRTESTLLRIPNAHVHLVTQDPDVAPMELARGDLAILSIEEEGTTLAKVVSVGSHLRWPLTKDEPVIKLDPLHYLFTLHCHELLNYGVTFPAPPHHSMAALDKFLKENTCFSRGSSRSSAVDWREYSPRIGDYNGALARAIAGGTGQLVKGIFMCSNAYARQVENGASLLQSQASSNNPSASAKRATKEGEKEGEINKTLRRVRKLSEMTEKMSGSLLNGILRFTSLMTAPLARTRASKSLMGVYPGEALIASLDAVNSVLDAIEAAERNTIAATSVAVSGVVSKRFGESAGQATEDAFATADHAVGTAWNLFKIRKAIDPSTSVKSSLLNDAIKNKKEKGR